MIRVLRAFCRLRWRLMLNGLRPTRRRDGVERFSRALQALTPAILVVLFVPAILLTAFLAFVAGSSLGESGRFLGPVLAVLRLLLLLETAFALLAPLFRATLGTGRSPARLLLLPIAVRTLYFADTLSTLSDPWLAILASGLVFLPAGWSATASLAPGLLLLAAGGALLALLAGLGMLSSSVAHLVFRSRRRGEWVSVALLTAFGAAGMLPAFIASLEPAEKHRPSAASPGIGVAAPSAPRREIRLDLRRWDGRALPAWAAVYPPELYARCVALVTERRAPEALAPLALLALLAAGVHGVGGRVHARLLETPEIQSGRGRRGARPRWIRLPRLGQSSSAVALAQVRLIFRTVQGKIGFTLIPLVVLIAGTLWLRRPRELLPEGLPVPFGVILALGGALLTLLTLEAAVLNQFALDRSGLTLAFLSPISDRELIRGKAAGAAILAVSRAAPCGLIALLLAPGGSPFLWMAGIASAAAAFFLLAPGGAIVSTLLPKTMDAGRIGREGKPDFWASLLGMLFIAIGAGPAILFGLGALLFFESPALAFMGSAGWAVLCAAISIPLFRLAERLLAARRENLALVAQGR
jgi:hypothetical protein